ncbi:MAG: CapA family protein [Thermomicrobiales bacterium]
MTDLPSLHDDPNRDLPEPRDAPSEATPVLSRRAVALSAASLGTTAVAAAVGFDALTTTGTQAAPSPPTATQPTIRFQEAATPPPSPVATTPSQATMALPAGMALVTSPRLPLKGISSAQAASLLNGAQSWRDLGSPVTTPVKPYAISGMEGNGLASPTPVNDYAALVAELAKTPGGVAVVPVDQVDFQVNRLDIDGIDPLATVSGAVRIGVTGDIIPGRNVAIHARQYGDWTHPFLKMKDLLSSFDVTMSNFECVISDTIAPPEESNPNTFDFIADPAVIDGMKLCGIDVISLANNHTAWNDEGWGTAPFVEMLTHLENAGFPYFGGGRDLDQAQRGWETTVGDTSIVLIGIDGVTANKEFAEGTVDSAYQGTSYAGATSSTPGTNPMVSKDVYAKIASLAGQYDIVIPYFHMGVEYEWIVPEWCQQVARSSIDSGATMVLTNHPHLIQGMEIYKNVPIIYSLGNFVFDQMFSVDTRTGYVLDLTIKDKKVIGLRTHGFEIEDFNQPRLMNQGEHAALMDRFWRSTDMLANRSE